MVGEIVGRVGRIWVSFATSRMKRTQDAKIRRRVVLLPQITIPGRHAKIMDKI